MNREEHGKQLEKEITKIAKYWEEVFELYYNKIENDTRRIWR